MLFYVIMAALLAFCIVDYKGKISYWLMLIMMFFLMAYQTWNADMAAYKRMFDSITLNNLEMTDPAFSLLIIFSKQMNLDYFGFVKIVTVLGLVLITVVFRKYSVCPALVLALYFIFTYSAETIQLRAFLSEAILYSLIARVVQEEYFNLRLFLLLLLIAFVFHGFSLIFFSLLLIKYVKDRKKILVISLLIGGGLTFSFNVLARFPILAIRRRILIYFDKQRQVVSSRALVFVLIFIMITIALLIFDKFEKSYKWKKTIDRLICVHYIGFISLILIILFSSNFYRMTRTIIVADFIIVFNYLFETRKMNNRVLALFMVFVVAFFLNFEMDSHIWHRILENNSALHFLL